MYKFCLNLFLFCHFFSFGQSTLKTNLNQIMINEEEEIINGDNTFTYLLFVPNSGAEVRIVGNKNGKKVKELIFTIKVGS